MDDKMIEIEYNGEKYQVKEKDLIAKEDAKITAKIDTDKLKENYGRIAQTFKRAADLMSKWYNKAKEKIKDKIDDKENDKFSLLSEQKMTEKIDMVKEKVNAERNRKIASLIQTAEDYGIEIKKIDEMVAAQADGVMPTLTENGEEIDNHIDINEALAKKEDLKNQIVKINEEIKRLKKLSIEEYADEYNERLSKSLAQKQKLKDIIYNNADLEEIELSSILKDGVQQLINSEQKQIEPEFNQPVEEPSVVEEVPIIEELPKFNSTFEETPIVEEVTKVVETKEPIEDVETLELVQEEKEEVQDNSILKGFFETEQGKMLFEQTKLAISKTSKDLVDEFEKIIKSSAQYYSQLASSQRELDQDNRKLQGQVVEEQNKNAILQREMLEQQANYESNYTANTAVESMKSELNSVVNQKEALLQDEQKKHRESDNKVLELTSENAELKKELQAKEEEIKVNYVTKKQYNDLVEKYNELSKSIKPLIEMYNQSSVTFEEEQTEKTK